MRVNTNVSHRAQQQLVLDNFGGVDFSSSPLLMASNRASNACNLINDNGVNHKRPGWEERMNISTNAWKNNCTCGGKTPCICNRINGIFQYREAKDDSGNECNVLIIYAGKKFYQCWRYPSETTFRSDAVILLYDADNLKNERVQFYPHKDKVYIIGCGDYLVFGNFDEGYEMKRVADTDVYVPTTSIYCNVEIEKGETKEWKYFGKSANVVDINLLTRKRINKFVGVYVDQATDVKYYTDSPFEEDDFEYIEYEYLKEGELKKEKITSITGDISFIKGEDDKCIGVKTRKDFRAYAGEDYCNVAIEYAAYETNENENLSLISNCRFGTLFGAGGASDRLFLSGNPDYPNADFYSEFDDYTYFTAQSQTVMGSDDVPITGYVRLSDSTLATMKAGAVYEPSIYYRQAKEEDAYIDEEQTVKKIGFTKWSGGTGEACTNPYVVASLAEDDLILSPNGVFGIVEVNNAATNSRYMRERSAFINGKLLDEPRLSEASAFVYRNRYYLAVPTDNEGDERNGAVYVADPRFKTYRENDIDGSFNYEWWYWENVPARVFAIIDGELWFGCPDGRVCRFDDQFTDRTKNHAASFTVSDGHVTVDEDFIKGLNNGDILEFDSDIYCEYLSVAEVVDGKIKCKADEIIHIYDGTEVYADSVGESGLSVATQYKVGDVDRGKCTFSLREKDSKEDIKLNKGGFRLCRNMKEKKLYIRNIDYSTCTFEFSEFDDSEPLKLVSYNNTAVYNAGALNFDYLRPVYSAWYTPVFSLGATDVLKTLLRMTVSVDPIIKGEVKFGYETRDVQSLLTAKVNSTLDFEDFSFEEFSFASEFATSYTVKSKARKFNYIMFKFVSDNDRDCAINNFKAIYTLTASHRGVF